MRKFTIDENGKSHHLFTQGHIIDIVLMPLRIRLSILISKSDPPDPTDPIFFYLYSQLCQFTLFYLSRQRQRCHNLPIFLDSTYNEISGKNFSLALHLAPVMPKMMPIRPDPDTQHWFLPPDSQQLRRTRGRFYQMLGLKKWTTIKHCRYQIIHFMLLDFTKWRHLEAADMDTSGVCSSVADPWLFGVDPDLDPRIHASDQWIRI
jgi:hypothetical protein